MGKLHDVLGAWREYARDVRGKSLAASHFLAEEELKETAEELTAFLKSSKVEAHAHTRS